MQRRELSDNVVECLESTLPEKVALLSKFKVGEYWETWFNVSSNPQDTTQMTRYVEGLKQAGLDIGKGDSQFGFKMPLLEKDTSTRYLQIFRRR